MIAIDIVYPSWSGPRRASFVHRMITIGTHRGLELRLTGDGVAAYHARFLPAEVGWFLLPLDPDHGTYVNDRRISERTALAEADRVQIGGYLLRFRQTGGEQVAAHRPYVARDAAEEAFLAAIEAGDRACLPVYADWLDQRGDAVCAEFLRLQDQLAQRAEADPARGRLISQIAARAAQIEVGWRIRVTRPPVERCGLAFAAPCTMDWSTLEPTQDHAVRHCGACRKDVHYALSVREARSFARLGRCVALDTGSARWPDDLAGPFGQRLCERCAMDIGASYPGSQCPACGHFEYRAMVVGRVS
jgi:uncharacterized protein (TIGR02996 family)